MYAYGMGDINNHFLRSLAGGMLVPVLDRITAVNESNRL